MIINTGNTKTMADVVAATKTQTTENTVVVQPTKSPEYAGSNVNLKKTSVSKLLVYIEGTDLTADYYSQILGADDELSEQQVGQSAIYQQYHKIHGLNLKLQDYGEPSEMAENNDIHNTISAILYPFIIPNVGDMFVADMELGKRGVFTITDTVRKRINKETCYEIEAKQVSYLTQERIDDFQAKTVQESFFKKDMIAYGQNPVLTSKEINIFELMETEERNMTEVFLKDFYNHDYKTLLVPDQETETIYDHRVVESMIRLVDQQKFVFIRTVREMGVEPEGGIANDDIWTLMFTARAHMLPLIGQKYWALPARAFNPYPMLNGIYHSGIRRVMWPINEDTGFKSALSYLNTLAGTPLIPSTTRLTTEDPDIDALRVELGLAPIDDEAKARLIKLVTVDDFYVLSEAFYTRKVDELSTLESYVYDLIRGVAIDAAEIVFLTRLCMYWGAVERFYYQPLLIILLRYCKSKY